MSRILKVAAAQLGPVHLDTPRAETVVRLIRLLKSAARQGATLVVFPELAFTTFFARHLFDEPTRLEAFFEHDKDISRSSPTKALFEEAQRLGVDICVGYAEKTPEGRAFNSAIYYSAKQDRVMAKYRKVHIPGTREPLPDKAAVNHLEKRYFEPGDLGFQAFRAPGKRQNADGAGDPILGMLICNDRRWPEAWRCYGLQGVEVILCGYNTPAYNPHFWGTSKAMSPEIAKSTAIAQHKLVMQANSYMNSCFSIAAGKAGLEDGQYELIGGSCIVGPEGQILAEAATTDDEVICAEIDLDECRQGKEHIFNFAQHRRVETYRRVVDQVGVTQPDS
ncbi:hypothetical protein UA08_00066 [Talaromyces atroroseus]|uniref:CN hydrolase domain-containing protein n=1 Tax=Talaromyces atroroseus TaxID=1441469 RepID=A0A225ATI0_TALAT|nr:hypothetical protein UA08_00066 [Talaromyces atroroseus]OKL64250.1 hypothetical protein UA08_00066 [Talaromyces atroroseus]